MPNLRESAMLECVQRVELARVDVAIRAALREPGAPQESSILGGRTFVPRFAIALHLVFSGEHLDVGDAAEQPPNVLERAFDVASADVLKDVGADDQIDTP